MPDILQDFPVKASSERVFQAITSPAGLDSWWTQRSVGNPIEGTEYELWFGPDYDWRAKVTRCVKNSEFELEMTRADKDWNGTRLAFRLEEQSGSTIVRFSHVGWPSSNEHYRISCHCWAMYLRIMRRHIEHGEFVPYENRLDV
jgi:uncharacterized protein YndB with AHSA1/START domain